MNRALLKRTAVKHLKASFGSSASFRHGQFEAIENVLKGNRSLVVQRTGWGKSIIYFICTRLLRDDGVGLSIVISPLLALMNDQLNGSKQFGLVSRTINSNNREEWFKIKNEISQDKVDILFISPERLSNDEFTNDILSKIRNNIGMLVIDEAHCISDWGHDFRPDYRRIVNVISFLPKNVPLLATTATANDRVVNDIKSQLGLNLQIQRGPLMRKSLALQVISLDTKEERLSWLVENIPHMKGTGIIYCLTKKDCELVSSWLNNNDIVSQAYYSGIKRDRMDSSKLRIQLEKNFMSNRMKALVATTAFGMGIDKPDIGFVVHFQKPKNLVSYYQQIGRAGRSIRNAYAVLLSGKEDDEINDYFIRSAFPTYSEMNQVIRFLMNYDSLSLTDFANHIDMTRGKIRKCLKFLTVNGDIFVKNKRYYKTPKNWQPDLAYSQKITQQRYEELERMNEFTRTDNCYMKTLAEELNDRYAEECGRCSNCLKKPLFKVQVNKDLVLKAERFIKDIHYTIKPRKKWPAKIKHNGKNKISENFQSQNGKALSNYGDSGWGKIVGHDKYIKNHYREALVTSSVKLIRKEYNLSKIDWITAIPSLRHRGLVRDFALRISSALKIPYYDSIMKVKDTKQQKELNNSYMQYKNAWLSFKVKDFLSGNVLLIDDMVDSRWTITVCSYKLISAGTNNVFPFALSNTSGFGGITL